MFFPYCGYCLVLHLGDIAASNEAVDLRLARRLYDNAPITVKLIYIRDAKVGTLPNSRTG